MATGLLLQGIGAERVESLVDMFNDKVNREAAELGLKAHPRYSPGYGDLPLTVQEPLLQLLNAAKRLGVTLSESSLLIPTKTVTAIIGLSDRPVPKGKKGCAVCNLSASCPYRVKGEHCS